jgi:peroxiredoxin
MAMVLTCFLGMIDSTLNPAQIKSIHINDLAPDFSLNTLEGQQISLSGFKGKKAVVLVFYRGWVGYW